MYVPLTALYWLPWEHLDNNTQKPPRTPRKAFDSYSYVDIHPNATTRYHETDMTLHINSDPSYISYSSAQSRRGGYFFLFSLSTTPENHLSSTINHLPSTAPFSFSHISYVTSYSPPQKQGSALYSTTQRKKIPFAQSLPALAIRNFPLQSRQATSELLESKMRR